MAVTGRWGKVGIEGDVEEGGNVEEGGRKREDKLHLLVHTQAVESAGAAGPAQRRLWVLLVLG